MMTYEEFVSTVAAGLRKQHGYDVNIELGRNHDGISIQGIQINRGSMKAGPILCLKDYYQQYTMGKGIDDILEEINSYFQKYGPELEAYAGQIGNFDKVRERIIFRLINLESNREFLKDIPYIKIHDLAVVFYLLIRADEDEQMTTVISNALLGYWKISVKELKAVAWKNSQKFMPPVFAPLERLLGEFLEEKEKESLICRDSLPPYVLSHQQGLYGAAAMLYPGMLKEAAEEIGSDLVVLPSSVNEVLLLPYEEGISLHDLRHLVEFINRTEVPEKERLSDNVYIYRREENTLGLHENYISLGKQECSNTFAKAAS